MENYSYSIVEARNDNTIETNGTVCNVLIDNINDLRDLPDDIAPGSMAYTANFSQIFCRDLYGDWIAVVNRK